jgi:hypothetical protein
MEVNRLDNRHKEKSNNVLNPELEELSRNNQRDPRMEIGGAGKSKRKDKLHPEAPPSNHMGIDRGRWAD